ncbi:RNA polymerase sigma factor FliA [Salinisphaera sp. Q1T1-3]|uniref:RNA polymerase sigma factor FliA n=1 Tax=Salinisphaera sp. Q1T1-3 TaxID=2321229 RepID=UPI000E74EBDC|nr:RNA polymerase sigma factor FliA [Salinisphaera sp. Q1T1-3]RJS95147.1 RNA polymerase sigma factor FliA [Salinisphaera sp. Q1T1-3]
MYTAAGRMERTQTIEGYMPMIRRHALALQVRLPPSVDLDDLIQAGTVGLLDALERFETGQGATFATYASQRVHGAMIDELRSRDWLPRSVRRGARELATAIEHLEHRLGRAPREREIAAELGLSTEDYHALLNDVNNGLILSYQEEGTPESEPSRPAASVDAGGDPFAATFANARREDLMTAIDGLPERERMLLGLYYQEDLNLKEIGVVLGVTESRVCQLHSQAVARLRKALPAYR